MDIIDKITEFDWGKGNKDKNWKKHKVADIESEEVFFNIPLIVGPDIKHSDKENRYYALGETHQMRLLFVIFTYRNTKIRVISARDMTRKERKAYSEYK